MNQSTKLIPNIPPLYLPTIYHSIACCQGQSAITGYNLAGERIKRGPMIKSTHVWVSMRMLVNVLVFFILSLGPTACGQGTDSTYYERATNTGQGANQTARQAPNNGLDDAAVITAQAQHAVGQEVTVVARVKKLLPEDIIGLPHQRFLIELTNNSTVLIAHDLKFAPAVPIQPGDVVCIHGEYIWNKLGGLIHWTHRSDSPRHESGWIEFNGMRYQ